MFKRGDKVKIKSDLTYLLLQPEYTKYMRLRYADREGVVEKVCGNDEYEVSCDNRRFTWNSDCLETIGGI